MGLPTVDVNVARWSSRASGTQELLERAKVERAKGGMASLGTIPTARALLFPRCYAYLEHNSCKVMKMITVHVHAYKTHTPGIRLAT